MENKKNLHFLIFISAVALVGGVNVAISGRWDFLLPYLLIMGFCIPCLYFNYTLCKLGNRYRTRWTHQTPPTDDEPSAIRLFWTKVSFWNVYFLGLFLSLIATFL